MATSKIDASDLSEEFKEDMEPMVTSDIPLHLSINDNGGLRITYDDGVTDV